MQINNIPLYFCTSFGIGHLSRFPGTLSSFLILPIIWIVKSYLGLKIFLCFEIFFVIFSFILVHEAIKKLSNKDPKFIVIDEYVGQSIALIFCNEKIIEYILAFIFFRFFDILKPFPINYFDKQKNSFGVVMDDISAGIISGLIIYFIFK